jgi:thiol-disulfide isomerase/thioredoxin
MLKKSAFYLFAALFIFSGQFLMNSGLVTGTPPPIEKTTLSGDQPLQRIGKGPALLYFWAEWCGVCRSMQGNIDAVVKDFPSLTVAIRSNDQQQLGTYLHSHHLDWPIIDDTDGSIGERYGVRSVPALFFINGKGDIVFTSIGYTSEWGLRFRLWLVEQFG